eukprot:m.246359 g.246359  ORF g.246359 m.246359 type:complete len:116 (+) comp19489_c0_seq13:1396-1743(+)
MPSMDENTDILQWGLEPGDAIAFHFLTLHAAEGNSHMEHRRRAYSIRLLGDDMVHAPRAWKTSPHFPGLQKELKAGAPMDHRLFPVLWTSTRPNRSQGGNGVVVAQTDTKTTVPR